MIRVEQVASDLILCDQSQMGMRKLHVRLATMDEYESLNSSSIVSPGSIMILPLNVAIIGFGFMGRAHSNTLFFGHGVPSHGGGTA